MFADGVDSLYVRFLDGIIESIKVMIPSTVLLNNKESSFVLEADVSIDFVDED